MPITVDEFFSPEREQTRRLLTAGEFFNSVPAAGTLGQTWVREDINTGNVDITH